MNEQRTEDAFSTILPLQLHGGIDMKIVKWLLAVVLLLAAVPLVAALFMSTTFTVERETVVERPPAEVFAYVRLLKNQVKWNKWGALDPDMQKSFRGEDGTAGAVYAWESGNPNVGAGELEIKTIDEGKRIDYEIRMRRPFQSTDPLTTTVEPAGEGRTKVKSIYRGRMNYPSNLLCFLVEDLIGDAMDEGFVKLKSLLETK